MFGHVKCEANITTKRFEKCSEDIKDVGMSYITVRKQSVPN